ncbi:MAG: ATP-binding cassette domain-containing protein [Eubacteriales bacterium]|nr:ATP-binding cassette domain-containing protein [Eubacteriales bacterium]MDY3333176.1 ATP-binding cassette domain-containing protein [Gallibacter sp.]
MDILEVNNLTMRYKNHLALSNVSFSLQKGKILGVIGPNGCGKTTLLKIIANLIKVYSGEVYIDGTEPSVETRNDIAFMPDVNILRKNMKVTQAVDFFDTFFEDFDSKKAYELLEFMDINPAKKIEELSKGMTEKMNLSLVLARNAKIYVIDEPLGGVDAIARDKILEAIIDYAGGEKTMIITTQLVRDIESIFDEVLFLSNGEVLLKEACDDLRDKYKDSIEGVYKQIYGGRR